MLENEERSLAHDYCCLCWWWWLLQWDKLQDFCTGDVERGRKREKNAHEYFTMMSNRQDLCGDLMHHYTLFTVLRHASLHIIQRVETCVTTHAGCWLENESNTLSKPDLTQQIRKATNEEGQWMVTYYVNDLGYGQWTVNQLFLLSSSSFFSPGIAFKVIIFIIFVALVKQCWVLFHKINETFF